MNPIGYLINNVFYDSRKAIMQKYNQQSSTLLKKLDGDEIDKVFTTSPISLSPSEKLRIDAEPNGLTEAEIEHIKLNRVKVRSTPGNYWHKLTQTT